MDTGGGNLWKHVALAVGIAAVALAAIITFRERPAVPKAGETEEVVKSVTIRVVDPDGNPVVGAKLGDYASWTADGDLPEMHGFGDPSEDIEPQLTDAQGQYTIGAETIAKYYEPSRPRAVYAIKADRELVGLAELSMANPDGILEIPMAPWCLVTADVGSTELADLDLELEVAQGYVHWNKLRPFYSRSTARELRYVLPPGEYDLDAYSTRLVTDTRVALKIDSGERTKTLNIDLAASKLAKLIGHPAPDLNHIADWKYSEPLLMADLRGKVVVLDFWGLWCGPCVASMPKLIAYYEEFHAHGLEIIAVHTAPRYPLDEWDEKLAPVAEKYWGGRELPFPVAIDGDADEDEVLKRYGATTFEYGINAWPTAITIDRQGNVVGEWNYRGERGRQDLMEALGIEESANVTLSEASE